MGKRLSIALALLPLALAPGIAGAESAARDGGATAQAFALKVVVPGGAGAATTVVAAPVDSVSFGNAGAFPSMDVVSWGGSVASASASPGQLATANASAEVTSLSLFQGEVTATAVRGSAQARASASSTSGDFNGAGVGSLVVNGQPAAIGPNARVDLGTWGYAIVLAQGSAPGGALVPRQHHRPRHPPDGRARRPPRRDADPRRLRRGLRHSPRRDDHQDLDGRSARPVSLEGPEVEAVAEPSPPGSRR